MSTSGRKPRKTLTFQLPDELDTFVRTQDGKPSEVIRGALWAAKMRQPKMKKVKQ